MLGTLLIYARCTYRVAELLGPNADSETLFMIDEGGTILAASIGLTLMHPGFVFRGFWSLNRARDEANGKVEIIRQGADGIALRVREV